MKRVFISLTLITQPVFAYYTETIPNQCGVIGNDLYAIFEINNYTCPSGQFLPADALGCVSCPNGYTCNGGTFSYNATESQGIKYKTQFNESVSNACSSNFVHELVAIFEPIIYTCAPGYYLPAGNNWIDDIEGCRICTQNNKCVGGTFTFNEITPQGIEQCANNTFAPTGSAVCYPHILHVGNDNIYLKQTKQTTPSLNIRVGNDIFYANMTTTRTVMTAGSSHYFKTIYNNTEYYICDDTTYDR